MVLTFYRTKLSIILKKIFVNMIKQMKDQEIFYMIIWFCEIEITDEPKKMIKNLTLSYKSNQFHLLIFLFDAFYGVFSSKRVKLELSTNQTIFLACVQSTITHLLNSDFYRHNPPISSSSGIRIQAILGGIGQQYLNSVAIPDTRYN
ncbi:hypothetical protein BpHYR1_002776 [Brachionus plicatilis]|uniref:Uncharacterized protein n=1 Tax=Brachionus plicatilis TaxID=10195 RepID=A0A3M7SZH4_BRAPC|nr:hypothetical protein BpHYR1_002776 [Brachionus plicatilis]